jgi:hypothetical protein
MIRARFFAGLLSLTLLGTSVNMRGGNTYLRFSQPGCGHLHLATQGFRVGGESEMRKPGTAKADDDGVDEGTQGVPIEPGLGPMFFERGVQNQLAGFMEQRGREVKSNDEVLDIGETGTHLIYLLGLSDMSGHSRKTYTGSDLQGDEWAALFYGLLGCPEPSDYPYDSGEDVERYEERYRELFKNAIPDYPMLARIWDMYSDVRYQSDDIKALQTECMRALSISRDEKASQWLSKLLTACDLALQNELGLFLASE